MHTRLTPERADQWQIIIVRGDGWEVLTGFDETSSALEFEKRGEEKTTLAVYRYDPQFVLRSEWQFAIDGNRLVAAANSEALLNQVSRDLVKHIPTRKA